MAELKQIAVDQDVLGGTPVFASTRVPVQAMFDYLEAGERLDDFLVDYPTVSRAQATAVLEALKQSLECSDRGDRACGA